MENYLMEKLRTYITDNNPDVLIGLQSERNVNAYLKDKVAQVKDLLVELQKQGSSPYLIEEICFEQMTEGLRPSKYHYIYQVLEDEFEPSFLRFRESGVLTYEIMNMIAACSPVFEEFDFSLQNEDDRFLRYAVIGTVKEYLDSH